MILDIQGENNCATIERLNRRLRDRVREINNYYKKGRQTPRTVIEPASKYHLILLPDYIRPTAHDIAVLKTDALTAEVEGNLQLARSLWRRLIRFETEEALVSLERIWAKSQKQGTVKEVEPETVPDNSGGKSVNKETEAQKHLAEQQQKQKEHEKKLERYKQEFLTAIQGSYPLDQYVRNGLKTFQQSLELSDSDVERIENPILEQKKAECQKQQEEERIRRQREEAELRRKQQETENKQEVTKSVLKSVVTPSLQVFEFEIVKLEIKVERKGLWGLGSKVKINTHRSGASSPIFY